MYYVYVYNCYIHVFVALYWACYGGHVEVVEELLGSQYININSQNKLGDTSLLASSLRGHGRVTHLLLNRNADANIKNNSGDTPISVATDPTGMTYMTHMTHRYDSYDSLI